MKPALEDPFNDHYRRMHRSYRVARRIWRRLNIDQWSARQEKARRGHHSRWINIARWPGLFT